jgi:hypothetical protein
VTEKGHLAPTGYFVCTNTAKILTNQHINFYKAGQVVRKIHTLAQKLNTETMLPTHNISRPPLRRTPPVPGNTQNIMFCKVSTYNDKQVREED